jgi:adenylosuccinate synthase
MTTTRGHATALVGAQYGSEGKGLVAAALAEQFDCHVRSGGPNAGHTFYHQGEKWVARSIPCGWINPEAKLYIGPGAMVDLGVLMSELAEIQERGDPDIADRLMVDYRATIITEAQHLSEGGTKGDAHRLIGSTGEGVGLARMSRINRDALIPSGQAPYAFLRAETQAKVFEAEGIEVGDVSRALCEHIEGGDEVLLEGTQGSGLSLTLGPWPYCTSADTNAAQLASDAGISPSDVLETILVARTFPIRVAGNSGPLEDEVTWEEVGQPEERTTVTKKVRRVGRWNTQQVIEAVRVNHPALLVVTFMDYLYPEIAGVTDWADLSDGALLWLSLVQEQTGASILGVGTGPRSLCLAPAKVRA